MITIAVASEMDNGDDVDLASSPELRSTMDEFMYCNVDNQAFAKVVGEFSLEKHSMKFKFALMLAKLACASSNSSGQRRNKNSIGRAIATTVGDRIQDLRNWFVLPSTTNRLAGSYRNQILATDAPAETSGDLHPEVLATLTVEEALSMLDWLAEVVNFIELYNGRDGGGQRRDDIERAAWVLWQFWKKSQVRPGKIWRKDGGASKSTSFLMASLALLGLYVSDHQIVGFGNRWKN